MGCYLAHCDSPYKINNDQYIPCESLPKVPAHTLWPTFKLLHALEVKVFALGLKI